MRILVICIVILAYTNAGIIPESIIPIVSHPIPATSSGDNPATTHHEHVKNANLPQASVERSKRQHTIIVEAELSDAPEDIFPGAYKRSVIRVADDVGTTVASVKTTKVQTIPAAVLGDLLG